MKQHRHPDFGGKLEDAIEGAIPQRSAESGGAVFECPADDIVIDELTPYSEQLEALGWW
jgi:hypothetical protein